MNEKEKKELSEQLKLASDEQVKNLFTYFSNLVEYEYERDELVDAAYLVSMEYRSRGFEIDEYNY